MVQLNTTYDKTLKEKVFVLKGEEAYARTTDVLADIISDFDDCNSHINYCRVGLEVDVLREVGDAFVNIYDNDIMLLSIPWGEDMDTIINNDYYNNQGIYWQDDKLIIGSSTDVDTGFFMDYDVEHNIRVDYTGNKQCLSSKSDVISFVEEKPDSYSSTLNVTTSETSYDVGDTVTFNVTLSISTSDIQHTIQVYDNGSLIDTLTIDANEPTTYTKSGLSEGLHSFRFYFIGDEEAFSSETTKDISVGYKLVLESVPSYAVNGVPVSVGVRLTNYFNNPLELKTINMIDDYGEISQSTARTDENGYVLIEPVYVGTTPIRAVYRNELTSKNYYSEKVTIPIYSPSRIDITPSRRVIANNETSDITITPYPSLNKDLNVPLTIERSSGTTSDTVVVPSNLEYGIETITGDGNGDITITANIGDVTATEVIEDVLQYWSVVNQTEFGKSYYNSYCTLSIVDNGYRWRGIQNYNTPRLTFSSSPKSSNLLLEFDVISAPASNSLGVFTSSDPSNTNSFSVANGDKVSIMYTWFSSLASWIGTVKVNGNSVKTISQTTVIGIHMVSKNELTIFDNFKLKKV